MIDIFMILLGFAVLLFVTYFWLDCYKKAGIKERQCIMANDAKRAVRANRG